MEATSVKIDLNSLGTLGWSIITFGMCEGKNQDNKRIIASSNRTRELELGKGLSLTKNTIIRQNSCHSSDRIISLTGYFGFIVPRGTRGSGQKKGAGGFAG